MTDSKLYARQIAEILSTSQIPTVSPLHTAMRDAVIDREAELIERLAQVAGLDLAALSGRLLMQSEDTNAPLPTARIEA